MVRVRARARARARARVGVGVGVGVRVRVGVGAGVRVRVRAVNGCRVSGLGTGWRRHCELRMGSVERLKGRSSGKRGAAQPRSRAP